MPLTTGCFPILASDLRDMAIGRGQKHMLTKAPVQIIYVVDIHRLTHTTDFRNRTARPGGSEVILLRDTGLIAGNVYLFAASQGLACWFHNCDRIGLTKKLKLRAEQRVLFSQTVGYAAMPPRGV